MPSQKGGRFEGKLWYRGAKPSSGKQSGKVRLVGGHHELHICARFVEEVVEDGTGDYVRGCGTSVAHGGLNGGHAVVGFEFLAGLVRYALLFSPT